MFPFQHYLFRLCGYNLSLPEGKHPFYVRQI